MKQLTIFAFVSVLATTASAENWVQISSSVEGGARQYVDLDRIERHLGAVDLWRVLDYPAPQREIDSKPFVSQLVHTEFDCPARAMRQVSRSWHAEPMGKGPLVHEVRDAALWEIDSIDESSQPLWDIACGEFER